MRACSDLERYRDGVRAVVFVPRAASATKTALIEAQGGLPRLRVADGIRVEPAASAPLAVELRNPLPRPTVLIVTGRNIDDNLHSRLCARA